MQTLYTQSVPRDTVPQFILNRHKKGISNEISSILDMQDFLVSVLEERKAYDVECFDLSNSTSSALADLVICATHNSKRAAFSLAKYIEIVISKYSIYQCNKQGNKDDNWIALDLDSIIIHIFTPEAKKLYNIAENLNKMRLKQF